MSPEERQAALDNISPEDLAKIQKVTAKKVRTEPEDLLLTEFALKFGWEAYKDVKSDKVSGNEMVNMIVASRKLEMKQLYMMAQASFIGAGSAQSKKPSQAFKMMTQKLLKEMEADK